MQEQRPLSVHWLIWRRMSLPETSVPAPPSTPSAERSMNLQSRSLWRSPAHIPVYTTATCAHQVQTCAVYNGGRVEPPGE